MTSIILGRRRRGESGGRQPRRQNEGATIALTSGMTPKATRAWVASAPTRDFRKAEWAEAKTEAADGSALARVEKPKEGFRALSVEADYEIGGTRDTLATQIRVLEAK
jgi:PhoPQ-activated pathogenicity-related protein